MSSPIDIDNGAGIPWPTEKAAESTTDPTANAARKWAAAVRRATERGGLETSDIGCSSQEGLSILAQRDTSVDPT